MFIHIYWDISPEIIDFGFATLRWYGLLFAIAFLVAHSILSKIFVLEKYPLKDLDSLTIYIAIGTIAGARLGHCIFYEPDIYLPDPLRIFKIWEGGLASHGAAIGILLAAYYYCRNFPRYDYFWLLDRLVITISLAGFFIRLGNLMNSEIIGIPTDLPWAFIFANIDMIPRHPAQLYEAASCLFLFFTLRFIYYKRKEETPEGSLLGIFMLVVFSLRFFFEFFKEDQVRFEEDLTFNMGQILSIPMIIVGFIILLGSYKIIKLKLN